MENHIHSFLEKSIIEEQFSILKIELMFDDYFPCRKDNCKLEHVTHWLDLFVDMHNKTINERRAK